MTKAGLKYFYKRYRKIINRVVACVILLTIILMFWHYISDLHKHIDLLAKYNNEQSAEINKLHGEIVADQHTIESLQQKITYSTHSSTMKVQFHQVTSPKLDDGLSPISATPTIIITAIAIIGGIIKNLVPSF